MKHTSKVYLRQLYMRLSNFEQNFRPEDKKKIINILDFDNFRWSFLPEIKEKRNLLVGSKTCFRPCVANQRLEVQIF